MIKKQPKKPKNKTIKYSQNKDPNEPNNMRIEEKAHARWFMSVSLGPSRENESDRKLQKSSFEWKDNEEEPHKFVVVIS